MNDPKPTSPLNQLLLTWNTSHSAPDPIQANPTTLLWRTVLAEVIRNRSLGIEWDVITDPRILWALQYIRFTLNQSQRIDVDLQANVDFILSPFTTTPAPTSQKQLAANNH